MKKLNFNVLIVIMLFLLCSCSNNTKDESVTKEETEKNAMATSEESVEIDQNKDWDINGVWYSESLDFFVEISDSLQGRSDVRYIEAYQKSAFDIQYFYQAESLLPENDVLSIPIINGEQTYNLTLDKSALIINTDSGETYNLTKLSEEEVEEYDDSLSAIVDEDYDDIENDLPDYDDSSFIGTWKMTDSGFYYAPDPGSNHILTGTLSPESDTLYIQFIDDGTAILFLNGMEINGEWYDNEVHFNWVIDRIHYRPLDWKNLRIEDGELKCETDEIDKYVYYYTLSRDYWPE